MDSIGEEKTGTTTEARHVGREGETSSDGRQS